MKRELLQTAHSSKINDICFPSNYSEVFATCSTGDIRIWHRERSRELLRILIPNLECNCITFASDGTAIYSGWNDGNKIKLKINLSNLI